MLAAGVMVSAAAGEPTATGGLIKGHRPLVEKAIEKELSSLEQLYKQLHANPELSYQEEKTAVRMARELRELGFEVTEKVGGHGVVGVLRNGQGPTVLVRTDMDGLPVVERTNLPYASRVRTRDRAGNEVGTMHACGHDMHMTCAIGVARVLSSIKGTWKGTLIVIAQPAEEVGGGARLMLQAGLFEKFPKPDYCLALHCDGLREVGTIGFSEGLAMANTDSVDILVRGKGGHGAAPHTTIDPIVLAARIVLDLQTLVSRETNPTDPAVVTVGSIHGGTKHNIISDEVKLQLTVRSTKDATRKHLLEGIERIAKAAAMGARAPEPIITHHPTEYTPALYNEPGLVRKTTAVFRELLGPDRVQERPVIMGGEDFSRYGKGGIPIFLFFLGTTSKERMAEANKEGGKPLPSMHSDQYYPEITPSIRTGVLCMSMAVLNLMAK